MKKSKTPAPVGDLDPDLNEESIDSNARIRDLDTDILKSCEEISGLELRVISAGDLALLLEAGVGILMGKTENLAYDVGAILFNQSSPRSEIRNYYGKPQAFRQRVMDFLDEYDAGLFTEATPRIVELVTRMNNSRSAVKGEISGGPLHPKAGGRAG